MLVTSRPDDAAAGAGDDAEDVFALARTVGVLSPAWVQTGCVYAPQPGGAFALLVMPGAPNGIKRHNTYHATCTAVAPTSALYAAYRSGGLTWHDFALRYLVELDAKRDGAPATAACFSWGFGRRRAETKPWCAAHAVCCAPGC